MSCRTIACNGVGGRADFEINVARADPLMRSVRPQVQLNPTMFAQSADAAFRRHLAETDFHAAGEDHIDQWYASKSYRNGDRYVVLSANCHWKDGSPECRVVLGEGSTDWPESDWNAVPLWRLLGRGGNYPLKSIDDLDEVIDTMCRDLALHAHDFLRGDLDRFKKVRAEQNRGRQPYMIHTPQSDGSYQSKPDSESMKLKDRFSNEA